MPRRHLTVRCLLAATIVVHALPLVAATFVVDVDIDAIDAFPGDGVCDAGPAIPGPSCTLRAAVMESNANGESDTIVLPPGMVFDLTLTGEGGTEVGDLEVTSEIAILGFQGAEPPANPLLLPRIDAAAIDDRHFDVLSGHLTLRGLRLVNGLAAVGGSVQIDGFDSGVSVQYSVFRDNFATNRGGAIWVGGRSSLDVSDSHFLFNDSGEGGASAGGGAININGFEFGGGETFIRRSSFLDNRTLDSGSTIQVTGFGRLRIENSTLDGSLFRPPLPNLGGFTGIAAEDQSALILRNTTITNYAESAVDLRDLDGDEYVRISNSILEPDPSDPAALGCRATGSDLPAADVQIGYSIVQTIAPCSTLFSFGVSGETAQIAPLTDDAPPRLTVSRRPTGPLSNVVDTGADIDFIPGGVQFACTDEDQLGTPRRNHGVRSCFVHPVPVRSL